MPNEPLRDAAVDPEPEDFLPPTNAGEEDPHGPLVVAPEIHRDKPAGLYPHDVPDDLELQEAQETALAQAVLVEGMDKPEAIAAAAAGTLLGGEDPEPPDPE